MAEDLGVPTVWIVGGVRHDTRRDGIQMDIRDDLSKIVLGVDQSRSVAALPKATEISPPAIEPAGHTASNSRDARYHVRASDTRKE
jgi:hypothetical protein